MIGVQICKDIDFFIISQKINGFEQKMLVRPSSFTSMLRSSIKTNPKSDNEHNSRVVARTDSITPKPMPNF